MVRPRTAVNDEFNCHTQRLFRLLNSMKGNTEVNKDRVKQELKKHKAEILAVVEANLVKKVTKCTSV